MALRDPDSTVGPFREQDTAVLTATVNDEQLVPIPGASLTSMKYTLFAEKSPYAIINARDQVDIKSLVDGSGVLTLFLTKADNAIVGTLLEENHRLLLEWEWDSVKRGSWEIRIVISNVQKVPHV